MNRSCLPNFVIVGAPKCGTTSVAQWLSLHPDAGMTQRKEPFYLVDEELHTARGAETTWYGSDGLEGYAQLFEPVAGRKVRFEATTHYLYQQCALEVLSGIEPRPKILVMVRQPSDRLRSCFDFEANHLAHIDPKLTFDAVVDALLAGAAERFEPLCRNRGAFITLRDALSHGQYADYIAAWKERFGDDLDVWTLEELNGDERQHMRRLAEWLGLDGSFYERAPIEIANSGYRIRWPRLHNVGRQIARRVRIPRVLRAGYWALARARHEERRSQQHAEAIRRLDQHYGPHGRRLEELLSRQLGSKWRLTR